MKRFTVTVAVAAGLLAAAPGFAQTATEPTKQPTQSMAHATATKQPTQSMAHDMATKQPTQSLSHDSPAGGGVTKQQ